jgi:Protein kinase domain
MLITVSVSPTRESQIVESFPSLVSIGSSTTTESLSQIMDALPASRHSPSPPSNDTEEQVEDNSDTREVEWRHCDLEDGVEYLRLYEPPGYHPVHLGDLIHRERYKIVHKLGHGGSSTVWMARDIRENRYVVLKIMTADCGDCNDLMILQYLKERPSTHPGRRYIAFVREYFRIKGPNGSHICLVLDILGPSVLQIQEKVKQLRGRAAQKVAWQTTQGLAYLHSEGVCHGGRLKIILRGRELNPDTIRSYGVKYCL